VVDSCQILVHALPPFFFFGFFFFFRRSALFPFSPDVFLQSPPRSPVKLPIKERVILGFYFCWTNSDCMCGEGFLPSTPDGFPAFISFFRGHFPFPLFSRAQDGESLPSLGCLPVRLSLHPRKLVRLLLLAPRIRRLPSSPSRFRFFLRDAETQASFPKSIKPLYSSFCLRFLEMFFPASLPGLRFPQAFFIPVSPVWSLHPRFYPRLNSLPLPDKLPLPFLYCLP